MNRRYLTAREAADELGIHVASLYAYVSRGLIRSEAAEGGTRQRRYYAEDVARLKSRKATRAHPEQMIEGALSWGAPILESGITLIDGGRLYYRGIDALHLAESASVEQVAGLIWMGDPEAGSPLFEIAPVAIDLAGAIDLAQQGVFIQAFQMALAQAGAADGAAYDLRPEAIARAGARILRLLTMVAVGADTAMQDIVTALQHGWRLADPGAGDLIRRALILCADHELNVSSFTARCVASARSTPYAAVIAGLSALQGTRHGGHTERIEALFNEIGTPEDVPYKLAAWLRRGEQLPCFGHRLYPDGDPRGAALIRTVADRYPDSPAVELARAVAAHAYELTRLRPTVDFGLVLLARALELPPGSALAVFALGRTVGWIGHTIEQVQIERLIRPRARYVGPLPG